MTPCLENSVVVPNCFTILKARGLKCISLVENQGLGSIVPLLEALEEFSSSPPQPPETACIISSPHLTIFVLFCFVSSCVGN